MSAKDPAPMWFMVLAIAVITAVLITTFGTLIWAVIKIVNHFI